MKLPNIKSIFRKEKIDPVVNTPPEEKKSIYDKYINFIDKLIWLVSFWISISVAYYFNDELPQEISAHILIFIVLFFVTFIVSLITLKVLRPVLIVGLIVGAIFIIGDKIVELKQESINPTITQNKQIIEIPNLVDKMLTLFAQSQRSTDSLMSIRQDSFRSSKIEQDKLDSLSMNLDSIKLLLKDLTIKNNSSAESDSFNTNFKHKIRKK